MNSNRIILIGCGGRGSNLVSHIGRLIKTKYSNIKLILCDGDIVEKKNLNRQAGFYEKYLGMNKAEVLATQLNYMFDIDCEFLPKYLIEDDFYNLSITRRDIIISEVDNHMTRLIISKKLEDKNFFWIDGANDKESGSTFICRNYYEENIRVDRFDYFPSIMDELDIHPNDRSCADNVASGEQDFSINVLGAAIDFTILEKYLSNKLLPIYEVTYNSHCISAIKFLKDYKENKEKMRKGITK